jgi:hypothetical protein
MNSSARESLQILKRSTQRITISVPDRLLRLLQKRADLDGRSLSNLCAYLLESSAERLLSEDS